MLERLGEAFKDARRRTAAALCLVMVACLAVLQPTSPAVAGAPTL